MPVLIIDGPEGSGKSTLVKSIRDACNSDPDGFEVRSRHWGKVRSWSEYLIPLMKDVRRAQAYPHQLFIWDRSWAAEVVYNELMSRGRLIDEETISFTLEPPLMMVPGSLMLMLTSNPKTLEARRQERLSLGENDDLEIEPDREVRRFGQYALEHAWTIVEEIPDTDEGTSGEVVLALMNLRKFSMKGFGRDRQD